MVEQRKKVSIPKGVSKEVLENNFSIYVPSFPILSFKCSGGMWEKELKSVKAAQKGAKKEQVVPETVLQIGLVEVESILNTKLLS